MKNKHIVGLKNYLAISALSLVLLGSTSYIGTMNVAGADVHLTQERSVGEIVDDATISSLISAQLSEKDTLKEVNVKVVDGRVLLTGKAPTYLAKLDAIKIAWLQPGTKLVNSDIVVTDNTTSTIAQTTKDSLVTSAIKSKLIAIPGINSPNYSIETVDGVVYVLGIARTQEELDKVLNLARNTTGALKVENYIRLAN